ncbi:sugar porter family MFS transporter [Lichenifustis flavocetrariae]|uniref:Sugar porter family MFS transporter n=1 Tax=Lichenifustis flavocetrariae TaxID=2949735 RepID=A0AA41Z053_9HYPH|nr:sugar porter family MFS transporter [Lichenifustis flavocetrariae]MCW6511766.1 sugar porter family MFS transporter [Lichenifustis flavocetrariae]
MTPRSAATSRVKPDSATSNGGPERQRLVYLATAISALGGMLFGYDIGVISGAILFIKTEFALSSSAEEVVVSAVLLGSLVGAIAGGMIADRLGRRKLSIVTAAVFGVGAIGAALAPGTGWLIAARLLAGTAIGVASFVAPLYISEIAPVAIRGKLVSVNQVALTSGIVISYLVDYAFAGAQAWRWMFALAVIPAAAFGIGLMFIPDSPRWLVGRGRVDEARAVLKRIRSPDQAERELKEIQSGAAQQKGRWSELLSPTLRPAMIVGVGLAIAQQITGINTVIYYAPTIFKFAGLSSASGAILASVGVGVINVAFTLVAMQLIDKVGRRPLLLVSLAGMALGLIVLGLAFALPQLSGSLGWIAVGSLMVYVGAFAVGLGPVFWLMLSEIYPLRIRGRAMSVGTVANWAANLVVALSFLTLTQVLGKPATFWLYGAVTLGSWVFAYLLVPETKGKTLEQIEAHWRDGKPARDL